jgi:shikimate dehydrogenase
MKAAVLGSPVAHSLSPVLHQAAYAELGLAGWSYQGLECTEADLPALLTGCGPDWAGLSLTMPLKRTVLPLLDWTAPLVTEVGCANTVVFTGGRKHGHNTDVPGMTAALAGAGVTGPGVAGPGLAGPGAAGPGPAGPGPAGPGPAGPGSAGPGPALILGGGATACSALACLRGIGLAEATVAVRDPSRATELLAVAGRLGMQVHLVTLGAPGPGWRLLISTLPAGAADAYAEQILQAGATGAEGQLTVLDVVYHPYPTRLVTTAEQAGAAVVGGFEFLLQQAGPQVELMTGQPAPLEAMRAAGLAELARRAAGIPRGPGMRYSGVTISPAQ